MEEKQVCRGEVKNERKVVVVVVVIVGSVV
jgi:hypothetical protein